MMSLYCICIKLLSQINFFFLKKNQNYFTKGGDKFHIDLLYKKTSLIKVVVGQEAKE